MGPILFSGNKHPLLGKVGKTSTNKHPLLEKVGKNLVLSIPQEIGELHPFTNRVISTLGKLKLSTKNGKRKKENLFY